MRENPLVSIIINNYNYGRFLGEAIDSVLNQKYSWVEVIVVDDGSTDNSHDIIEKYGQKITAVFKERGGQNSALNKVFPSIKGEIVFFLDADDKYLPTTVEIAVHQFFQSDVVNVQWPMWEINSSGNKMGRLIPKHILSEGNLQESVVKNGPDGLNYSYASGIAWKYEFLSKVFPLPEINIEGSGMYDAYLSMLAPFFGCVGKIDKPLGYYRVHSANLSRKNFEKRHKRNMLLFEHRARSLAEYCRKFDIIVNQDSWVRNSWHHRLEVALQGIVAKSNPGDLIILVDDNQWGIIEDLRGRNCLPFLEKNRQYWGPPADDQTAIQELTRLRNEGANFIVFAWPAFWWLDYYGEFHQYLRLRFRCVLENDRLVVFDLGR